MGDGSMEKQNKMRYINEIIIHCTATPPGKDIGAAEITNYHTKTLGWKDCGYHYIVRLNGSVERGRYISQPGAHCRGHNAHSVGVAYVGGLDENGQPADTRTPAQKESLLKIIVSLIRLYHAQPKSHRDYNPLKACPSFDATSEYKPLYEREMAKIKKF